MTSSVSLPRVTIKFCTQCKWLLRAAYVRKSVKSAPTLFPIPNIKPQYAQELLSTFSTSLGEVSLQPSTGGTFVVTIEHASSSETGSATKILWDRKTDGGFPETKELKRRVRDVIEPERNLGHVDRDHGTEKDIAATAKPTQSDDKQAINQQKQECEDCK